MNDTHDNVASSSTNNPNTTQQTTLPTIAQKLAELQEINATRLRISHLEAALAKQDEKIAKIMSHIEELKLETQRNLGDAYTTIDVMYAAIPMMELNLQIMGISEEGIRDIMDERIEEIGVHLEVVEWVKGYADATYESAQAKMKHK